MAEEKNYSIENLRYISTESMYEGVLVEITDASVTIDLKGRLGQLKIPKRMLISNYDLAIGQEVGFMMSYPEILSKEPNDKYVTAIEAYKKHQEQIQQETIKRKLSTIIEKGEK